MEPLAFAGDAVSVSTEAKSAVTRPSAGVFQLAHACTLYLFGERLRVAAPADWVSVFL